MIQKNDNTSMHGVALSIYGMGVILLGESSVGKSEAALELVSRGHTLIVDDLVTLKKNKQYLVIEGIKSPMLHIRGLGFMDINKLYKKSLTDVPQQLDVIVELIDTDFPINILHQLKTCVTVLGVSVLKFQLPCGINRPIATLIELVSKYCTELKLGYDYQQFIQQQVSTLQKAT